MIVVMAGLPGTGKTTLARALADRLGGVVVNKDRIRAAAFEPPVLDYSAPLDDFAMELVYASAAFLRRTRSEIPLFIDGRTFARRAQVERMLAALPETPRVIECVCDAGTARARLEADTGHPARNRTFDLYRELQSSADPIEVPHLTIDTGQHGLEAAISQALAYLTS